MLDYAIIGGGITGVTTGRLLDLKKKSANYVILEAEDTAGGLCRSTEINGHVLDIGGGHFLSSKYQDVYDFIFQHISKDNFNYFERVSKIRVGSETIDYPIESNIWQLSIEEQIKYLISIAQAGELSGKREPKNYAEWIRWKLGNEIAENYMIPYNKKIWGVTPDKMDIDWLYKIPRLNIQEIFASSLTKMSDKAKFPSHQGFYYPKHGGFQEIFNAIYSKLRDNVKLRYKVNELKWNGEYWTINNDVKSKHIINTIPWPWIYKASGSPAEIKQDIQKLQYNSLAVSLYEVEYDHDYHWLYLPQENINHHREFFVHNFAPHSNRNTMYTETNIKRWTKNSKYNGSKPLYEHVNEAAYPIPILGNASAARNVMTYYRKMNMHGIGRWGQWQYFNSDVCIKEAMKFVEAL